MPHKVELADLGQKSGFISEMLGRNTIFQRARGFIRFRERDRSAAGFAQFMDEWFGGRIFQGIEVSEF